MRDTLGQDTPSDMPNSNDGKRQGEGRIFLPPFSFVFLIIMIIFFFPCSCLGNGWQCAISPLSSILYAMAYISLWTCILSQALLLFSLSIYLFIFRERERERQRERETEKYKDRQERCDGVHVLDGPRLFEDRKNFYFFLSMELVCFFLFACF